MIDLFLRLGFLVGFWAVPRFGRIRMQIIGFASMAFGMLLLMIAVHLSNSILHVPLVFAGFILFNLLMNAGLIPPHSRSPPSCSPRNAGHRQRIRCRRRQNWSDLGVFVLPILKDKFGVPAVLAMMAVVSVLGMVVTLAFGHEDTED